MADRATIIGWAVIEHDPINEPTEWPMKYFTLFADAQHYLEQRRLEVDPSEIENVNLILGVQLDDSHTGERIVHAHEIHAEILGNIDHDSLAAAVALGPFLQQLTCHRCRRIEYVHDDARASWCNLRRIQAAEQGNFECRMCLQDDDDNERIE